MPKRAEWNPKTLLTPQALAGLPADTAVLLAFSGGADSRALLHILAEQARCHGFQLILSHVNHGIRGEEARRDRDFCQAIAARYGLELCLTELDVPALAAAHGRGLEEEARRVRYACFEQLMRERRIPILVTAHHADDHLETLLFRLCRGTGSRGLGGIAPVRRFFDDAWVVRPLLRVTHREIVAYCEAEGLEYVTDSTNADIAYARNRIRAEIVPVLESLFDDPQRRAVALSEDLRRDEAYLASLAQAFREKQGGADGSFSVKVLTELPDPILRRVLTGWVTERTGELCERVHVEALTRLIRQRGSRDEVALSGGYTAYIECGRLTLSASSNTAESFEFAFSKGITDLPAAGFRITVEPFTTEEQPQTCSTQSSILFYLPNDETQNTLSWRSRREGDLLLLGGMHRRLRRLYREAGISPRMRERIPLLCDREGIVWAPFLGVRDGLSKTGEAYLIKVERFNTQQFEGKKHDE